MSQDSFALDNRPALSGARLNDPKDAHFVLDLVQEGKLPQYRNRLGHNGDAPQPGQVYVHDRQHIPRWTDNMSWGTSRTRKGFRCYDANTGDLTRKTLTIQRGSTSYQVVAYDYRVSGPPLRSVYDCAREQMNAQPFQHQNQWAAPSSSSAPPLLHEFHFRDGLSGAAAPVAATVSATTSTTTARASSSSHMPTPPDSPLVHTPADSPYMASSHRFEYDRYDYAYEYSDAEDAPMTLPDADPMHVDAPSSSSSSSMGSMGSSSGKIELPPLRSMVSSSPDRQRFEEPAWAQRTPTLEPLPHGTAPRFPYDSAMIARLTTKI